jgi:hypothetical protein
MARADQPQRSAIVALAGRRIDTPHTHPPRFPLEKVTAVRRQIADLLAKEHAVALVCSAACGADLIALDVAGAMGLKRRVVLSSPPERFRASSVVDRPGDFGPAFDRVIADLERTPDLVVLGKIEAGENPYETANRVILDQAMMLASAPGYVLAVIVWEGRSRGDGDLTQQFAVEARARGIEVVEIVTV